MVYDAFWLLYLRAHGRPSTRALHYAGTTLALICLGLAALRGEWQWLPAAPIIGYAFAWAAHLGIEGNRPQTFGHPLWSLVSDLRMLALAATGRLPAELERAGAQPTRSPAP